MYIKAANLASIASYLILFISESSNMKVNTTGTILKAI